MRLNIFLLLMGLHVLFATQLVAFDLRNGDLIFQESCVGDKTGDAIKNVTKSSDSYQFTHVGIVFIPEGNDSIYVIEATAPKVRILPIGKFLRKDAKGGCIPTSVVGRICEPFQHCIPNAIKEALMFVGKDYDFGFILNNDKYYCSELIYDIFLKANNGIPIFDLNVMTFKKAGSEDFDQNWIQYFKQRNLNIPEGEMGINPGAMSLSDKIQLLGEIIIETE